MPDSFNAGMRLYMDRMVDLASLLRLRSSVQGCMDPTEPQAGSDLGGIVARIAQAG